MNPHLAETTGGDRANGAATYAIKPIQWYVRCMGRRLTACSARRSTLALGIAAAVSATSLAATANAHPARHADLQPQTLMRYRTTRAMEILGYICRDLREGQVTISRYEAVTIDGILRTAAHVPGHGLQRLRSELAEAIDLNQQAQAKLAKRDTDDALNLERLAISNVGHVLDVLRREK